MSGPQIDDPSKPTTWWNTSRGAILIAVLVYCIIIDFGGWLAGQSGLIIFLLAIGDAVTGSEIVQVGDNSFSTIFLLISYIAATEINEIFEWKKQSKDFSRRELVAAIFIYLILFFAVGDFVLNQTFVSFSYQRCALEERVGVGKFRYSKVWFARDPVKCPQPADPRVKVE